MRKISVFNFLTLNGFYKGNNEDISWHKQGTSKDENEFAGKSAQSGNVLLFGRKTYEMMASYWPTKDAMKNAPKVADGMNKAEKIVFSKTLKKTDWKKTTIVKGNLVDEVKKLKKSRGKNMTILGSGTIVTQLAEAGLIDEYMFMVDPVALGTGTPVFKGITHPLDLELVSTKKFKSGSILLTYQPAG